MKWWSDETEKIVESALATGGGGLFVGIAKGVVKRYGGVGVWAALLCASVLVAILTGFAIHDSNLSVTQQFAVIGVCSFLAEDILLGLMSLSALFATDPISTIRQVYDALRGKEIKPIAPPFPKTAPTPLQENEHKESPK